MAVNGSLEELSLVLLLFVQLTRKKDCLMKVGNRTGRLEVFRRNEDHICPYKILREGWG